MSKPLAPPPDWIAPYDAADAEPYSVVGTISWSGESVNELYARAQRQYRRAPPRPTSPEWLEAFAQALEGIEQVLGAAARQLRRSGTR
jgi:hypothetical protein